MNCLSVPEERNKIIQKYIPKLITSLTHFNPKDENYKLCLEFAYSKIKHHRYLSVNSHDVKGEIDGICKKLELNSFHEEAKTFKKRIEELLTHDLVIDHYEKDVMYSIINLLTTLAYDPIRKIKDKKRRGLEIFPENQHYASSETSAKGDNFKFMQTLLEDNFKLQHIDTDSELSEWTESEDEEVLKNENQKVVEGDVRTLSKTSIAPFAHIMPPEKSSVTKKVVLKDCQNWLLENIQNRWWTSKEISSIKIKSAHPVANFYVEWQRYLRNKSLGLIKANPVSLLTEYCLLREVFWMLLNPTDCKFFSMANNTISLRSNVTLHSCSIQSLNIFLQDIVEAMNILHKLRIDIEKSFKNGRQCHTLENYYNLVQVLINDIFEFLLGEEEIVRNRSETYTVVTLHDKFQTHLKTLRLLWKIHDSSILDDKCPPHIRTAFLLSNLNSLISQSSCKQQKNLCTTFYVACIKSFLEIFDLWWSEARLQDLSQEFLVEKIFVDEIEIIRPRLYEKSRGILYINDNLSAKIQSDSIIRIMKKYSAEAALTLEIISKLDRVHEMKQIDNNTLMPLYDEFLHKIMLEVESFSSKAEKKVNVSSHVTPKEIFNILNESTGSFFVLPLEQRIELIINHLLGQKISIAEQFVLNIYLKELKVLHYLQEIRKVFFLESSDVMNFLYFKLFPQFESLSSKSVNPYLLTVSLNDAVACGRQISTLFTVNIKENIKFQSVLASIDDIFINVNVNQNLQTFFTPPIIKKYNDAFKFLLKIKWSQRILNTLHFPEFYKRKRPYAKLEMIDLVIKRLALIRFSLLQVINTIHNYLMITIQGLCNLLTANVSKAQKITVLIEYHKTFVDSFHAKIFLDSESKNIFGIIIEILKLAKVVKDEWHNVAFLESRGQIDDSLSLINLDTNTIVIEKTFKICESELRHVLND